MTQSVQTPVEQDCGNWDSLGGDDRNGRRPRRGGSNAHRAPRYRGARPRLAPWLRRDPLGYVDGSNVYQYVRGKPVDGLDPTGLQIVDFGVNNPDAGGPPPRPILVGELGITDKSVLKRGYHGWGGTNIPIEGQGRLPLMEQLDKYRPERVGQDLEFSLPMFGCAVVQRYVLKRDSILGSRVNHVQIERGELPAVLATLNMIPGRPFRFFWVVLEFNTMADAHEKLHRDNLLRFNEPLFSGGVGPTIEAARKAAKQDFEDRWKERKQLYIDEFHRINNNGDRERGNRLLNEINDLLTVIR